MRNIVVMGVSGCGKSSVGEALATRCDMTFLDADDLHPAANIAKMSAGKPLTDADREPWLDVIGQRFAQATRPTVIACSALRRRYRDRIRAGAAAPVHFLHLATDIEVIAARMQAREGHFMPPSLLQSQFDTLEPLGEGEMGCTLDIALPVEAVVADAVSYIQKIR